MTGPRSPPLRLPRYSTAAILGSAPSATVRIYGRDQDMSLADITCLWYGCLDTRTVQVILARHDAGVLALVTTDLAAGAAALITRYAGRWSIEQAFADAATSWARARPATAPAAPSSAPSRSRCSSTPWSSPGMPGMATTRPASPPAGMPSPGTAPRLNPPSRTCSPSSAAS